jgi:hypothetical protein
LSLSRTSDIEAQTDVEHLLDVAIAYRKRKLPPGIQDPEEPRESRFRLGWFSQNHNMSRNYRARTWGFTILRTTNTDDVAFDTAVRSAHPLHARPK